jgi:hypothetical protein
VGDPARARRRSRRRRGRPPTARAVTSSCGSSPPPARRRWRRGLVLVAGERSLVTRLTAPDGSAMRQICSTVPGPDSEFASPMTRTALPSPSHTLRPRLSPKR